MKSLLSQSLDDLECEKAQNVNNVIVRLAVGVEMKAGPFPEPFSFAEGEGCLSTFAVVDIFLPRHVLGTFVGGLQSGDGRLVHLLFLLVLFVVSFWHLFAEVAGNIPRKRHLGSLVFLSGVAYHRTSGSRTSIGATKRIVTANVGCITSLIVRIFGGFADVLPRQEGHEA